MKIEHKMVLTKKEKAEAKKTLAEVRRLFGNKGQHWIKGDENDGNGNYCLIGALDEADGPGMAVAKTAVVMSLPEEFQADMTEIDNENDGAEVADGYVPTFNDRSDTTFKNVRGVLTRAGKLLK